MADETPRYNVASPGVSGAIHDAVSAVRKTLTGYHSPEPGDPSGVGGRERAQKIDEYVDDNHSSYTASNAGRTAQSSDHQNSY